MWSYWLWPGRIGVQYVAPEGFTGTILLVRGKSVSKVRQLLVGGVDILILLVIHSLFSSPTGILDVVNLIAREAGHLLASSENCETTHMPFQSARR